MDRRVAQARADLPADLRAVPRNAGAARAERLDDGIWGLRLPLPYPAPSSVNAYLLAMADGFALVDCGSSLEPGWEALEHAVRQAGADLADVHLLVCTHLHADHAGLAATVIERSGCQLMRGLGPDTVDDALRDPVVPLEQRRAAGLREGIPPADIDVWVDAHIADDVRHDRVQASRLLVGDDVLASRTGRWRVIPARGHSPSQIALFEERRRWLISADLAYATPEPFIEYGWTLDPLAEHMASLERALRLEPSLLLPGHGRPVADAQDRLTAALGFARALPPWVASALSERARSAYDVVGELLGIAVGNDRRQSMMSITLSVLEHLERSGRAISTVPDDGVRRFATGRTAPEAC